MSRPKLKTKAEILAYGKGWAASHRASRLATYKRYRESHKEKRAAYNKTWRKKHPELCAKNQEQWKAKYPEKATMSHREANKKWQAKNLDRHRLKQEGRRSRKLKNGGRGVLIADWHQILIAYDFKCAYCGCGGPMTMDHIMPLVAGGRHEPENIVPACRRCNSRKNDSIGRFVPVKPRGH